MDYLANSSRLHFMWIFVFKKCFIIIHRNVFIDSRILQDFLASSEDCFFLSLVFIIIVIFCFASVVYSFDVTWFVILLMLVLFEKGVEYGHFDEAAHFLAVAKYCIMVIQT